MIQNLNTHKVEAPFILHLTLIVPTLESTAPKHRLNGALK